MRVDTLVGSNCNSEPITCAAIEPVLCAFVIELFNGSNHYYVGIDVVFPHNYP